MQNTDKDLAKMLMELDEGLTETLTHPAPYGTWVRNEGTSLVLKQDYHKGYNKALEDVRDRLSQIAAPLMESILSKVKNETPWDVNVIDVYANTVRYELLEEEDIFEVQIDAEEMWTEFLRILPTGEHSVTVHGSDVSKSFDTPATKEWFLEAATIGRINDANGIISSPIFNASTAPKSMRPAVSAMTKYYTMETRVIQRYNYNKSPTIGDPYGVVYTIVPRDYGLTPLRINALREYLSTRINDMRRFVSQGSGHYEAKDNEVGIWFDMFIETIRSKANVANLYQLASVNKVFTGLISKSGAFK